MASRLRCLKLLAEVLELKNLTNIKIRNMKIGIIGAGAIGYNLAKKLAPNHEVRLAASKMSNELINKATAIGATAVDRKEAVKDVDLVILSIPLKAIAELPEDLFEGAPEDLIIVDTSNYYPLRDGNISELDNGEMESLWSAKQLGRPIIKAFNNVIEYTLVHNGKAANSPERIALSIAGDSEHAKKVVGGIVNETGFDVVDGGKLADSWRQQPGTPAYCTELNSEELKNALKIANKKMAAKNRDEIMHRLINADAPLTHDQILALNRQTFDEN